VDQIVSVVRTVQSNAKTPVARTRELVEFACRQGYRTDELVRIIEDIT
jgi:hypothetical protein